MKQNTLVALLIITLIANIILGFELYSALHPSVIGLPGKNTSSNNEIQSNTSLYSFSFKIEMNLHIEKEGKYLIQIKPTNLKQLSIIIYFSNGHIVQLSLNNTQATVHLNKHESNVTIFIYGESFTKLSQNQILKDINLTITRISNNN
ncbi:hypothetical protein DFR86_10965 [Acidianus sulfidivorans JP7]|uniref:Uncharacterized protein n=1 Tax=Acidianus sulfidivorans JP7 TaxID=619593 RepID=A0A2U9IPV7_9CREN|nr:hypothetical protein [Acidianus sulfidivorans]AWR98004.1 hypothetical protein DFR86_10965 [Acidianus sulfidivorans JP7]